MSPIYSDRKFSEAVYIKPETITFRLEVVFWNIKKKKKKKNYSKRNSGINL